MGWAELDNGDLLDAAEAAFDALITTDQNLRYQQNLSGRRLAILVLPKRAGQSSNPTLQRLSLPWTNYVRASFESCAL
jgi:hypothetical protein